MSVEDMFCSPCIGCHASGCRLGLRSRSLPGRHGSRRTRVTQRLPDQSLSFLASNRSVRRIDPYLPEAWLGQDARVRHTVPGAECVHVRVESSIIGPQSEVRSLDCNAEGLRSEPPGY